jgi:predicted nucleotidyltransferase
LNALKRVLAKPELSLEIWNQGRRGDMMKPYKRIANIISRRKKELAEKYSVKDIGVFGSFARGEQKRGSDVDILVEFEEVPDLFKFIEMERYLEKLLKKKVDLVEKTALKPRLKDVILSEVIYV